MELDLAVYRDHLTEARSRLGLAIFDPQKHPRGFHGRWASAVAGAKSLGDVFGVQAHKPNDTLQLHSGSGGKVTKYRQALHDQIINDLFEGHKPKAPGQRVAMLTSGGSASGKSRLVDDYSPHDAVHIDADVIKAQLPEYRDLVESGDDRAAGIAHEESSMLAKRAWQKAIDEGYNVTFDGTGGGQSHLDRIDHAHAAGHKVDVHVAHMPTDRALELNKERAAETGRLVDESFVRDVHKGVSRTYLGVHARRDKLRTLVVHDHSVEDTHSPAAELRRGKLVVHNGDVYTDFLRKAHE